MKRGVNNTSVVSKQGMFSLAVRVTTAALWAGLLVQGAIWPEKVERWKRTNVAPVTLADPAVWTEFGLKESEQVDLQSGARRLHIVTYQFQDSTGAFAGAEWLNRSRQEREWADRRDNYVFAGTGAKPTDKQLDQWAAALPKSRGGPPPNLNNYLPGPDRVANSEGYILGPASLQKLVPQVPERVASFGQGAEGVVAQYRSGDKAYPLAIFTYPTPHIARQRLPEFEKLPGAKALRAGPMVAVTFPGEAGAEAEKTLASVRYDATVTVDEATKKKEPNVGSTMLSIFALAGVLILICLAGGLGFAGMRLLATRFGSQEPEEAMISLHLGDK